MRLKIYLALLLFGSSISIVNGQDADTTKIWDTGLQGSLTFNQVSLTNWAAGGDNSLALSSFINIHANRKKNRSTWENSLNMAYGMTKIGNEKLRKSDDKIEFSSKYGYQLSPTSDKLSYSSSLTFRSQFANGFDFPNDSVKISKFLAPGYFLISTGLDYKPAPYFSIFFSPLTGKITVVSDDDLAAIGAFGVDPGENSRGEFGSFLKLHFNKEIFTNVNLESKIDLFSNYADNPGDIDVNWETAIVMKINEFLSANFLTHLIYDKDIKNNVIENGVVVGQDDNIQFKQVFGIGLTFKI